MGFATSLVVYLATFIRLLAFSTEDPPRGPLIPIMAAFGLILVTEPWIKKRINWYTPVYLIIQSVLATLAFLIPPRFDFLPVLLIPLTVNAVVSYGYPAGCYWIGFFTLTLIYPMIESWDGSIEGYFMIVLFAGIYLLSGSFAIQLRKLELSRKENERLLIKLKDTHRDLEEYKAQIEDHAAARTRNQMAQELHDSVTQTIFTVSLAAQTATILYKKDPESAKKQVDRMVDLAGGASEEITDLVSLFRPRSVINKGLPAALRTLALERGKRDHLKVTVVVSGNRELPEGTSLGLYRIAQEALNNVSRHAGTDKVEILLNLEDLPSSLEIIDNGMGFELDERSTRSGHFGLAGMSARAAEIGWMFNIESYPGKGTHIHIEESGS
jgi:signal transduction histidine kinase